ERSRSAGTAGHVQSESAVTMVRNTQLRGEQPGWISLAGEIPDSRRSPRTRFVRESDVALHEVVGILLGGRSIPLDQFDEYHGELVALMLYDGSSLFKRVGASLPGNLLVPAASLFQSSWQA